MLNTLPRIPLSHLPTPLEPAPRLGKALGLTRLYVKRDDCTGLALGGNKARKLEFLMADALAQGADVVLTVGGVQSNHARQTAAAARKCGMDAVLVLDDERPDEWQGNLLLDALLGARVVFKTPDAPDDLHAHSEQVADELRTQGRKPYLIPVGGSNSLGCLGYVEAVREVAEQTQALGLRVDAMVFATGSCGTQAGMTLGAKLFMPTTKVIGISVSRKAEQVRERTLRIAHEAAERIGAAVRLTSDDVLVNDGFIGPAYGIPTEEGNNALRLAARTEGLVLDPVYTGKALAGLKGLVEAGAIRADEVSSSLMMSVIFWHTGGAPGLFALAMTTGQKIFIALHTLIVCVLK